MKTNYTKEVQKLTAKILKRVGPKYRVLLEFNGLGITVGLSKQDYSIRTWIGWNHLHPDFSDTIGKTIDAMMRELDEMGFE